MQCKILRKTKKEGKFFLFFYFAIKQAFCAFILCTQFHCIVAQLFFGNVTGQGARAFAVPAATSVVFFAKDWFFRSKSCKVTRFKKNTMRFYRKCSLGQQTFVKSNIEKKVTRAKKGDFFKKQSVSSKSYSKFSLFVSTGVHLLTKSGKICKLQVQKHCHISTVCPAN